MTDRRCEIVESDSKEASVTFLHVHKADTR